MDKIKTIKIKEIDGSISENAYYFSSDASNVEMDNGANIQDVIGTIDLSKENNIAKQLENLKNKNKLIDNEFSKVIYKNEIIDNLDSLDNKKPLSAKMGNQLNKNRIFIYNTLIDMKSDTSLKENAIVKTLGYYTINDGGGAFYKITTINENEYQEKINDELYATLIIENETIYIKQLGAKGDGVANDTLAVKTAFEFYKNRNLKIVFNNNGVYLVDGTIYLYSNKEIDLNNCSIKARARTNFYSSIESTHIAGYGALKNISIKNGTIDGSALGIIFGILHGENLFFENVKFLDCSVLGHIFDLGGCKNVKFENCNFTGMHIADSSKIYREIIQPDYANRTALPYWGEDELIEYDNLPTINLTINRCNFEKGKNGINMPNAIGTHALYGDLASKNIVITNNTFHDSTSYTIRFPRVQNLVIDNNIFYNDEEKNYTGESHYILLHPLTNSDAINPEPFKDIRISNNTFYKEIETHLYDAIHISGNANQIIENILIENNVYYGNYDNIINTKVADFLHYSFVRNLTISNNTINKAKNTFIRSANENVVYKIKILNNQINNCRQLLRFQVAPNDINEYTLKNNIIQTEEGFLNDNGDVSIFGVESDYIAEIDENRLVINNTKKTNGLVVIGTNNNNIAFKTQVLRYKVYGNITIQNNDSLDKNYDFLLRAYTGSGSTYNVNQISGFIKGGETKTFIIPTTFVEVPSLASVQQDQFFWITPGLKAGDKIIADKTQLIIETC